jgi:hypothetical protein
MGPEITIFTPMVVFFWGYVKDNIYVFPFPATPKDSETRVTGTYAKTDHTFLKKLPQNVEYLIHTDRAKHGSHNDLYEVFDDF